MGRDPAPEWRIWAVASAGGVVIVVGALATGQFHWVTPVVGIIAVGSALFARQLHRDGRFREPLEETPRTWDWFRFQSWIFALSFLGLGLIGIFAVATDDLAWHRKLLGLSLFLLLICASGFGIYRLRRP